MSVNTEIVFDNGNILTMSTSGLHGALGRIEDAFVQAKDGKGGIVTSVHLTTVDDGALEDDHAVQRHDENECGMIGYGYQI